MSQDFEERILCIGAGYVGGPTMAMIADKCPQYRIDVVDISEERINQWNSDKLPIFEPGLKEIVDRTRGRNLFFSTDIAKGIEECDIIFVCVNTPTKLYGQGAGQAADLQFLEKTARFILQHARTDKIVVEKSTVPVRSARAMAQILHSGDDGVNFEVVSNPEFLAEGSAINDLLNPDRVLLGSRQTESGLKACRRISAIYENWVDKSKILQTNTWSSELGKLVSNAFLAQRISSINSISALCEKTDANVRDISYAVGMDSRIGSKFLNAGVGFGGSCFKKDILNLAYICRTYNLDWVADYWEQVIKINEMQQHRFVSNMIQEMFNTISGKSIAIFGFSFKPDTGDTRESPAISVCRKLHEEQALLRISDPQALPQVERDLAGLSNVETFDDPYEAANDCHAIALMTEWKQFKELDYRQIFESMEKPAFIFDGRNHLDHQALYEIGFNVYPIGQSPLKRL